MKTSTAVRIAVGHDQSIDGDLDRPDAASGVVVFAHGSGSSRHSRRNQQVARSLGARGFATLLIDLLTPEEEAADARTAHVRFDIEMLATRLAAIVDWIRQRDDIAPLRIGFFGASTGGGAALMAAAGRPDDIAAVVSRGGRPDLAGPALPLVKAPTLLIVGGDDTAVIQSNEEAMARMEGVVVLEIVPGASHLFEERGALERVAQLAGDWFERYLVK
jgi:dienelactone hydrolase